jgi:RNA polymerase sigma-70 factor, ECF subfamily
MSHGEKRMSELDEQLVSRVQRGDHEAFGQLYDQYAGLVRSICFESTGDVTSAQDLSQEVFLSAYRQLDQLKDPKCFCAWLMGIARLSGRQWRRNRFRDRHELAGENIEGIADQYVSEPEDRWTDVLAAMSELTENERLGIHLFYLKEQPADLARQLMNLSLSGFYRLLTRARGKLAKRLALKELKP